MQNQRLVDVIVGGQWGSEGKGNIANFLASEYPNLMRVGGPNAGHYVIDDDGTRYCHRLLPSGSRRAHRPSLLIGPGATLNHRILLQEIEECGAGSRIGIHPQTAIITDGDIENESSLVGKIGSTGQGVGQCAARRILRNGDLLTAGDMSDLKPYLADTTDVLRSIFRRGERVLLEGTQGTSLSLYHGSYPWVTSRDTCVAGTCAEAGIAPAFVDRVYMVCRTFPIRVYNPDSGFSGPMKNETTWAAVANQAGWDADTLANTERGSVSGKIRRVAEFDIEQIARNAHLNGATDIALTFADYLDPANASARTFAELTPATQEFILEIEERIGVFVSLISVNAQHDIIDRRNFLDAAQAHATSTAAQA